ncbi:MAG: VWA domain-containing protein [Acidobacteriota bacterium]
MKHKPSIEIITERRLYPAGRELTVDALIRITPPAIAGAGARPRLNLSLVLDRSGSMQGEKIIRAREAACYCIDQLLPTDRVSVVIFDDVIEVIVPSQIVENREQIKSAISRIGARNSTALHEAWVRGGMQVSEHLIEGAINRVLLITDGLANVGETNTDRIVTQSGELAERNVTTSTIGIGSDFNENLLIPMAEAGRGNAWHVREAAELERIFATELEGLIAQLGHTVSLGLTPNEGVKVEDVLNDFEMTHTGRYKLPNLRAGSQIDVVARLKVPAKAAGQQFKALDLRLAWTPQAAPSSEREVLGQSVVLEFAHEEEAEKIPADERAIKAVQNLMAARARLEAIGHLDRGDVMACLASVRDTRNLYAQACASMMDDREVQQQLAELEELENELAGGADRKMTRKRMSYQSYQASRQSKTTT